MDSLKQEFLKIELMQARIELRLNPKEHRDLIGKLRSTVRFNSVEVADIASHTQAVESLLADVQIVLKTEWKRVKRGEPIYWLTKWISLLIFIGAATFGLLVATDFVSVSYAP